MLHPPPPLTGVYLKQNYRKLPARVNSNVNDNKISDIEAKALPERLFAIRHTQKKNLAAERREKELK